MHSLEFGLGTHMYAHTTLQADVDAQACAYAHT